MLECTCFYQYEPVQSDMSNRFSDRDLFMRFFGGGIGHLHQHSGPQPVSDVSHELDQMHVASKDSRLTGFDSETTDDSDIEESSSDDDIVREEENGETVDDGEIVSSENSDVE